MIMSHFTELDQANINSKEDFIATCKDLGFTKITENTTIKAWDGNTRRVEVAVHMAGYDIGLYKKEDGTYGITGDWWGIQRDGLPEKFKNALGGKNADQDIQNVIRRHAAKTQALSEARRRGYRVTQQEEDVLDENGKRVIRFRLTKY
jgi:hypothetical protein